MTHADLDSLRQLPITEKLRVVEVLWDDIATSTEEFPLSPPLRGEVERRIFEYDRDPSTAITREDLWRQVDGKRG